MWPPCSRRHVLRTGSGLALACLAGFRHSPSRTRHRLPTRRVPLIRLSGLPNQRHCISQMCWQCPTKPGSTFRSRRSLIQQWTSRGTHSSTVVRGWLRSPTSRAISRHSLRFTSSAGKVRPTSGLARRLGTTCSSGARRRCSPRRDATHYQGPAGEAVDSVASPALAPGETFVRPE